MVKDIHLDGSEIKNNVELKEYLEKLRTVCYELYIETMWTADILQGRLSRIKGVTNRVRARIVAGTLKAVGEAFKLAGKNSAKTWTEFEKHFGEELAKAPSAKRVRKDPFEIK